MATVDRVLPWRRHHETAAASELTPLLASFRTYNRKARVDTINRAYHMAAEAHRSQTRSSGESYINHPLAVAKIVADIGLDDTSIAAEWLGLIRVSPVGAFGLAAVSAIAIVALTPLAWVAGALAGALM